MKFTKKNRYGEPFWFNGVYKIVKYDYSHNRGGWGNEHFQCYIAVNQGKQWGDYVNRGAQKNKDLTFNECVALCDEHAKTFTPTPRSLENAAASMKAWSNDMDKWGEPLKAT